MDKKLEFSTEQKPYQNILLITLSGAGRTDSPFPSSLLSFDQMNAALHRKYFGSRRCLGFGTGSVECPAGCHGGHGLASPAPHLKFAVSCL